MAGTCVRLFVLVTIALACFDTVQCQNRGSPPIWNIASTLPLTLGIREDKSPGDVIATLQCTDDDGDNLRYKITKGNAVRVHPLTGVVTLAVKLDFEKIDSIGYHLEFGCYDVNSFGERIHNDVLNEVEMTVKDANDENPEFEVDDPEGYFFKVLEGPRVGFDLDPVIKITDRDREDNAKLSKLYLICNSPFPGDKEAQDESSMATCDKFSLKEVELDEGKYEARLRVEKPLDFETTRVYSSKMVAIDGPTDEGQTKRSSTINIQIVVLDAQDQDPVFVNLGASTIVSEGATPGSPVNLAISAKDGDVGDQRPIKVELVEDSMKAFTLDPAVESTSDEGVYAARLRVQNPLDREALQGAYEFVVKIIELDKETMEETLATATATYSVQVADIDDEPPRFAEPVYYVNVTEMEYTNQAVEITGIRMVCTDPDTRPNGRYSVRITDQPFPNAYSISPGLPEFTGTAILFLTSNDVRYLDYDVEAYRSQTIVIKSESSGVPRLSGSTTVSLRLVDINDNRPKFDKTNFEFEVSENIAELPYIIDTIKANDIDSGDNGKVTYRLEGGTSSKFEINPATGELTLVQKVDYEDTPLFVFLVYAEDSGPDKRISQAQINVKIKNENDQKPVFLQSSYDTSINENDFFFFPPVTVSATDNEEGTGVITYEIVDGQTDDNVFILDPSSGELTLRRNLKYTGTDYKVVIEASDNGSPPQKSQVTVTIAVIDQNNFAPVLKPKLYTKTLSELVAPGTLVTTILGTDDDEGDFGKIQYRIVSGAFDNFVIDPDTGIVTVNDPQTFDFDKKSVYNVKIRASDTGAPQLFDEATLTVTITDGNNKKPSFPLSVYIGTVDEKEDVDFVILTVKATDLDSDKDLFFSFVEITARDGTGRLLTDTFPYDYKNVIGIREKTGEIYIKNKLDKEEALEFTFIVQVEDRNAKTPGQRETTRVAITVQGDPKTDLTFNRVEPSTLNEDSEVGYEITTVTAEDPVTGRNVNNYELVSPSDFFEVIRATGEIKLKNMIDYEEDPRENIIQVKAIADDGIRTAVTFVTIRINDQNDNKPKFKKSIYYATVDEDAPSLTSVVNIEAEDLDTPSFGPIGYQIFGGLDYDHFSLYRTGDSVNVIVAKGVELDYNNRDQYDLDIIARDNLNKQFSTVQQIATVKLIITVRDKNNHRPEFIDEGTRKMAVSETAELGRSIGTISATDKDFGENGDVFYTLKPTDDPSSAQAIQLFTIVSRGGIVRVANSLLGFGERIFKMEVFAQDGGAPFLSNSLDLEIEVLRTENNDGNPLWYFPPNNYILYAPEEEENYVIKDGSGQTLVFNTAPRTGAGIVYSISPLSEGYEFFSINPATGSITVTKALDREEKASYNLLVYAGDTSNVTEIRTGRQIVISLQDKDDNEPTFTNPKGYDQCGQLLPRPLEISFNENTAVNNVIFTVGACDPDVGKDMYYYLFNENDYCRTGNQKASQYLEIKTNGQLVIRTETDYEYVQSFVMCVYVTKTLGGEPWGKQRKKRSFDMTKVNTDLHYVAYLFIKVKDLNDNKPIFPKRIVTAVMLTDARDEPVVVLDAHDKDGVGFNIPVYTIVDAKFYASDTSQPTYPGRSFVIENNELRPDPPRGQTFQQFAGGRFVLTIRAEDPVDPSEYDEQDVTIYVHKKGQAMKVILDLEPSQGALSGEGIVRSLDSVSTRYNFRYLHVSAHNGKDGLDKTRTDVCFIAVDSDTHTILNINELLDLLAKSSYEVALGAHDSIENSGKCYPSTSSEEHVKWKDLWWVLVVVAIFLGVCSLFFIIIIIFMHRRYRRYMKTEKTYLVPQ